MSKPKQVRETQFDKTLPKKRAIPVQFESQISLSTLLEATSDQSTFESSSLEGQVNLLSNPNLQTVQRQVMAARIGQIQGNSHLQRIIGSTKQGVIQRQGPAAAPPRPTSGNETIARAIALYMASTVSTTRLGRQLLSKLIELHGEAEIGFAGLEAEPGYITNAEAREGIGSWGRVDIAVNEQYRFNVIRTSLELVHEALHHVQEEAYVDEELAARGLQIDYYTELKQGIPFGRFRYQVGGNTISSLESQRTFRARGQLVDYVMTMPGYRQSVEAAWVKNHINHWGGIKYRWRYTRARYLQVLSEDSFSNIRIILNILESESNAQGFNQLMAWVGSGDRNQGLATMREAIQRSFALYAPAYFQRIQALQESFKVNLGIRGR